MPCHGLQSADVAGNTTSIQQRSGMSHTSGVLNAETLPYPGQAKTGLPMRSCLISSVSCRPLHLNIEGCIGFRAYRLNPK